MKPLVLPASTSLAVLAGSLTTLTCAALKHAGWDLNVYEQGALTVLFTVAASHFTTDSPSAPVAREAVADAAADADMDAAERKK